MENLPRDIALDILSRLPITSFLQAKCVCKDWLSLAQDPRLPTMFYARANMRNPSLILHCDSPIVNSMYFIGAEDGPQIYTNKVHKIVPRFIDEYQVVGSCNGLLCISDALYTNRIYICNIINGDYMELPRTSHNPKKELSLGFGSDPTTLQHKVVRVEQRRTGGQKHCSVQILTIGQESWRNLGPVRWNLDVRPSEVMLNGSLHWVTKRYNFLPGPRLHIISFNLGEEKFKEIERPICGSLHICNFHLAALRDCLSAVACKEDGGIEIWVMQVYDVKESWTKDYVIRGYVPASLNRSGRPESRIWKNSTLGRGAVKVVCVVKNGEVLMKYGDRALVLYSPEKEEFKELVLSGLPRWFSATTHVETLLSVEAVLRI